MRFYDLKKTSLERVVSEIGVSAEDFQQERYELEFYDKYFLVEQNHNLGIIKIWRQHVKDPYLDLELEQCDIAHMRGKTIPTEIFIEVLDKIFELPQLVRCEERNCQKFKRRGFIDIPDKEQKKRKVPSSCLLPILMPIDYVVEKDNMGTRHVRLMKKSDIKTVENMFALQYSLRYRAIRVMYLSHPESCFVYDDGSIKGVILGEPSQDTFYIHQMFVSEECRGTNVASALLQFVCDYTKSLALSVIRGTIRGNLLQFYARLGVFIDPTTPKSYYLIRFNLP